MKSLALILISFLLFLFGGNKHYSDLREKKLKGKVKSLTETKYSTENDSTKPILISKDTYIYDNRGNQLEEKMKYYDSTNWDWVLTTKYNTNGYRIEDQKVSINNTGRKSLLEGYGLQGLFWKISYLYNDKGKVIRELFKDSTYKCTTILKYDTKGNLATEDKHCSTSDFDEGDSYKYNKRGLLIENIHSGFEETSRTTWKYDTMDNIIQEMEYTIYSDTVGTKILFKYDAKGNNIERAEYIDDGKPHRKWTYRYEDYDAMGNWLKRVEYFNDKPSAIIKRQIEYYP